MQQVDGVADQAEPHEGAGHLPAPQETGGQEGRPRRGDRGGPAPGERQRLVTGHAPAGTEGPCGAHGRDRHARQRPPARPPAQLSPVEPVEHGAGEHRGDDGQTLPGPDPAVGAEQHESQHGRGRGAAHTPPPAGRQRRGRREQHDRRDHHDLGGAGAARQRARRKQAAHGDGRHGEGEHAGRARTMKTGRARTMHTGHEHRRHEQVEDHLVRQRPEHVDDAGHLEKVLQHRQVRQDRGARVVRQLTRQRGVHALGAEHRPGRRRDEPQGIQAEDPVDPEPADAAAPFQRDRHHVSADEEEHQHAVLAEVEPRADARAHLREQRVQAVLEHHDERGHAAQRVQPSLPRPRRRGRRPRPSGRGLLPDLAPARFHNIDGHPVRLVCQSWRIVGVRRTTLIRDGGPPPMSASGRAATSGPRRRARRRPWPRPAPTGRSRTTRRTRRPCTRGTAC